MRPQESEIHLHPSGHQCETDRDAGFGSKTNGELPALAEDGFDVLITIDKNIRFQQNLNGRKIALLIAGRLRRLAL